MKNIFLILALISTFINAQKKGDDCTNHSTNVIDFAEKPMESHTFFVSPFTRIEATSGKNFIIKKADKRRVEVKSNASCYVVVSSKNGILKIEYDMDGKSFQNAETEVIIYTDKFDELSAKSLGNIKIMDDFKLNNLKLIFTDAGKIEGDIDANYLEIDAEGISSLNSNINVKKLNINADSGSKLTVSGIAEKVNIDAKGIAKLNIKSLKYKNINIDGDAFASINVK